MPIPVAIAGADQIYLYSELPKLVVLSGSATNPPITSWTWTMLSVPLGSTAKTGVNGDFTNGIANIQNPQFTMDVSGSYILELTAQNAEGYSVPTVDQESAQTIAVIRTEKLSTQRPGAFQYRYDDNLNETLDTFEDEIYQHASSRHGPAGVDPIPDSPGIDTDAIHDNLADEINQIAAKATPVVGDKLVIEDSADSWNKKSIAISDLPSQAGGDSDAIHDNVADEINQIAAKATPVVGDKLVIEDSADTWNKKSIAISDLPAQDGADSTAIHDNIADEIHQITNKAIPVATDEFIIEDSADTWNKKRVTLNDLLAQGGGDGDAIHDNVSDEINQIAAKATPAVGDKLIIEDSTDFWSKKSITLDTLPAQDGADSSAIHDDVAGEIDAISAKATPVVADKLVIEDSADTWNKKSIAISDLPPQDGADSSAIHDDVAGEIDAISAKATPVVADKLVIEDSADTWNKKSIAISDLPPQDGADSSAIHDDVAGEIDAISAKATPVVADKLVIEDSADTWNKKSITIDNLPAQDGADSSAIHDDVAGEIDAISAKATPVVADKLVIEDSADTWNKKSIAISDLPPQDGADSSAIHDDVAGEIDAISAKATPVVGDKLVIEDSADTWNKKSILISSLPSQDGGDSTAIHDNIADEINQIAQKVVPVDNDIIVIEDSANLWNKKKIKVGDLLDQGGGDNDAIHDNVDDEIHQVTEKLIPVVADEILIEDSADTWSKKRIAISNLPAQDGADSSAIHDNVAGEIDAIAAKGTPVVADKLVIEDSANSWNKKSILISNLPAQDGADSSAIHDDVAGEINAIVAKATPVVADKIVIEDSADTWNKKSILISNLPAQDGADSSAIHDDVAGEINAIAAKATPVVGDKLVIEDSADTWNKKSIAIDNLPPQDNLDSAAFHDNVGGEVNAITYAQPLIGDLLLFEDSSDSYNKKKCDFADIAFAIGLEDTPPTTPSTYDDEFNLPDGSALDPKWSWYGAGEPSLVDEYNILNKGRLIVSSDVDSGTNNVLTTDGHVALQPLTGGNADFRVASKLQLFPYDDFNSVGVVVLNGTMAPTEGACFLIKFYNKTFRFYFWELTGGGWSLESNKDYDYGVGPWIVGLEHNEALQEYRFMWGPDADYMNKLYTHAKSTTWTATQIGLITWTHDVNGEPFLASFNWFRFMFL